MNKNIFFIVILFVMFLYTNTCLPQEWEIDDSGYNIEFNDIFFVDSLNGWAVGENSSIIRSTDGGRHWEKLICPIDSMKLNNIQFTNTKVGYITGNDGLILSTINGGDEWHIQDSGTSHNLYALSFINDSTGWITTGDSRDWSGIILNTSDSGNSWNIQFDSSYDTLKNRNSNESIRFREIKFINKYEGWVLGMVSFDNFGPSFIIKTSDGGKTWELTGMAGPQSWAMSMVSPNSIWVGGFGFAKSTDSGINWEWVDYPGNVVDLAQINDSTGWSLGAHLAPPKLYYTDNNWETYTEINVPASYEMKALTNISDKYLWVMCDSGIVYSYKKSITSIDNSFRYKHRNFIIYNNYPNPFNPATTIKFYLYKPEKVTIEILNSAGEKIDRVFNKELMAGLHSVNFNGEYLASGIYFYRIIAGNYTETKKMILIK